MSATASLFSDAGLLAQAIADATDDAVFARDREGRYQYANPAMLAAIGRGAAQVLGRRDDEVVADAAAARRAMAQDRRVLDSAFSRDQPTRRRTGASWIPAKAATWSRR